MLQQNDRSPVVVWLKVCLFLSLFIWQLGVEPVRADIHTICQSGCDFDSIQTAVNDSNVTDGDILSFTTARETYDAFTITNKTLTFQGNDTEINANDSGAVITIVNGSKTVSFEDFRILNGSSSDGGGIHLTSGNLTLTNVLLNSNDAADQGGSLYIGNSNSTVTLDGVTISGGTAVLGGAIYNNGTLNASNLTLTDNNATNGGGLYNDGAATLNEQSAVQRNTAAESGGGLFNADGATLTLLNSDVANNDAANGAGIANIGTLQTTNINIGSLNVAIQAGGGIHNTGQATLLNSTVVQNQADTGAGIYNEGTLTANNSTFSRNAGPGNQHNGNGPGLYNQSGTAVLNNVTIHLTVGTSIFANGGTVEVGNTIISSALGTSGLTVCGGGGNFISNGYNLASDQSCAFLTETGDIQGINPDLNGITSPAEGAAYHSPKLTSPVIDAGNPADPGSGGNACLASDQRGLERPQSKRCDIGAVEIVVYRVFTPLVIK
ncbi:MAG: hypothetical protein CL608_02965 [Anaerolineaceae bacterium]|nr:hypothetical protein [Anaerolineaceae bacterium]